MFKCCVCNKEYDKMGYGVRPNGDKVCYPCCGHEDFKELMNLTKGQKVIHYLTERGVENWPGSLIIRPYKRKRGKHNIAGTREDVWFELDGKKFHGVQYGDFSQICHITTVR